MSRIVTAARSYSPPAVAYVGLVGIGLYVMMLGWAMEHRTYDDWGVYAVFPVLLAISLPALWRLTRDDALPIPGLLGAAVVAKLLASLARYYVVFAVYQGNADAATYHERGIAIRDAFRSGAISVVDLIPHTQGTKFLEQLTGLLYSIIGPTILGGFMVFAWMGFWGLVLTYRAVLIAFPEIDVRRYAKFLFFLPSMLFWPSSLGKESWLMLTLGITFNGAARLFTARRSGVPVVALGLALTAMVRPHVTAVALVALIIAFLFRPNRRADATARTTGSSGRKAVILVFLVIGVAVAISQSARFLGVTGRGGVGGVLDSVSVQTSIGGSAVNTEHANSIAQFPNAVFTVLFRPTILEARNVTNAIAAMETTALLLFFATSLKRLRLSVTWMFRRPYLLFCIAYSAIFSFAWSSIANLGILARQRTLAWPAVVLLLALPKTTGRRKPPRAQVARPSSEVLPRVWAAGPLPQLTPAVGAAPAGRATNERRTVSRPASPDRRAGERRASPEIDAPWAQASPWIDAPWAQGSTVSTFPDDLDLPLRALSPNPSRTLPTAAHMVEASKEAPDSRWADLPIFDRSVASPSRRPISPRSAAASPTGTTRQVWSRRR